MHKAILWSVAAVLSFSGSQARATVLFNNFGPGQTYDMVNQAGTISGSATFLGTQVLGLQFTPSVSGTATQIDVAISFGNGFADNVTLSLQNDNAGLPGTTITSWSLTSQPMLGGCCDTVTLSVPLTAGTLYWLVATPGASNTFSEWSANNTGDNGLKWFGGTNTSTNVLGAFDVIGGTAVPEPGTVTAGVALLLIGVMRRARRRDRAS